jgi:hypothetical protein
MFYDELSPKPDKDAAFDPAYAELGNIADKAGERKESEAESQRAELQELLDLYTGHLAEAHAIREQLDNDAGLTEQSRDSQIINADHNIEYNQDKLDDVQVRLDALDEADQLAA